MNAKKAKELRRCLSEYYAKFPKAVPTGYRRVAGEGSQIISPRRMFYRRLKRVIGHYGMPLRMIRKDIFTMLETEETRDGAAALSGAEASAG